MTTGIETPGARRGTADSNRSGGTSRRRAAGMNGGAPAARGSVTTAILVATVGGSRPAAAQPWDGQTVLRRLVDQLASLGVDTAHVIARPEGVAALERSVDGAPAALRVHATRSPGDDLRAIAGAARDVDGGVVVLFADMVTHREALAGLLAHPRVPTGILTAWGRRPFTQRVRASRGRIVSAASPYHVAHRPTTSFYGVLKVAPGDAETLAATAEHVADLVDDPPPEWRAEVERTAAQWRSTLAGDDSGAAPMAPADVEAEVERRMAIRAEDVISPLLVGLVRADVKVGAVHLRRLFWARPLTGGELAQAAEDIEHHDEDRVLLDSSVKGSDGFFTTFFVSSWSPYVVRWAARRGISPNAVTIASLVIGVAAAAAFATGERAGYVAGALLAYLAFVADCVDGQLARYTRTFSKFGAWLDSVFDRTKEYVLFAGLAIGSARAGDDVWVLAAAALALQTVRHTMDFSFMMVQQHVIETIAQPPLEQSADAARQKALDRRAATAADDDPPPRQTKDDQPSAEPAVEEPAAGGLRMAPRRVLAVWRRLDEAPALLWLKKMAAFPIGERFAVISIATALFEPRVTFAVLLAWGGFAVVYAYVGRFLRSVAR